MTIKNENNYKTKIYNPETLYVVNLSDLCTCQNNITYDDVINRTKGERHYFKSYSSSTAKSEAIILKWAENDNGQKCLEEILTGTKIYLFSRYMTKQISKLKQENISYVVTGPSYPLFSNIIPTFESMIGIEKYINAMPNVLALNIQSLKQLNHATEEENESLRDYWNKNHQKLQLRISYIEELKNKQQKARQNHKFRNQKNYTLKDYTLVETVKQHIDTISEDFASFSAQLKAKQKTLTKH